eukprot:GHVQ01024143.1.p1 GENE.GHVQ01024143.1~~GHVQ01024143.1.p1  ORF type:complete len:113 (-),score=4.15 GHVQ01024143.1:264-602(-)
MSFSAAAWTVLRFNLTGALKNRGCRCQSESSLLQTLQVIPATASPDRLSISIDIDNEAIDKRLHLIGFAHFILSDFAVSCCKYTANQSQSRRSIVLHSSHRLPCPCWCISST